jgi:hypothetical protein
MTNYPFGFDNNITLPGVSGTTQEDIAITALRSSVFAVEIELGITPSGIYPDVRTRLDILESRLQFGVSPNIPNDGYVKSPLFIWNVPQNIILTISDGYGTPTENRLSGSLYMRSDGTANHELYIRRGNQWFPIQTDLFSAGCDLTGTYTCQNVIGIQGKPLNPSLQFMDGYQDGYHLTWNTPGSFWEAQTGFIPGRDLAIFSGPYGRTGQTVIGLQGSPLAKAVGSAIDGYSLIWEAGDGHWEPQALAVVFGGSVTAGDGYVTKLNLRSNKFQQSPSALGGSTGMINFGTSTNGAGGVSANYAMILGGDRNNVSGVHGLVVGGFTNSATDGYSAILTGNGNTASTANATVINGVSNIANQPQALVANGLANTAAALSAIVLNGSGNSASGNYSGVLNGVGNSVSLSSVHAAIGFGSANQIQGGAAASYSAIFGGNSNVINGGQNTFLGTPAGALVQANYSSILSGLNNTVATLSDFSVILTGFTNFSAASSEYSIIGTGNNNTIGNLTAPTAHYLTILNADTCSVGNAPGISSLHSQILGGSNNSVVGSYLTILNGNANSISGNDGYSTILDGYNHSITGIGSLIGNGSFNSISGIYSTILNGNINSVAGRNSTILNGNSNTIDAASIETTVLTGDGNSITNSANSTVAGSSNTVTNASTTFIVGTNNNTQSIASFMNGSGNTLAAGASFVRIFGSNNTYGGSAVANFTVGNGNNFAPTTATSNTFTFGSNNVIDGVSATAINGQSNISNSNFADINGQFGKARLFGQEVRANSRFTSTTIAALSNGQSLPQATINVVSTTGFPANGTIAIVTSAGLQTVSYIGTTPTSLTNCTGGTGVMSTGGQVGKIGEVQWSRLILTGTGASGVSIPLQLQDTSAVNPTFQDGYSYDLSIRVLVVNTSPIGPNPVVPARFVIDLMCHQESGVLVVDSVNRTLTTPQASGTPWTVSVSGDGLPQPANNQLAIQVDTEVGPPYVQPANTPSSRRAIATIDMREMSRI